MAKAKTPAPDTPTVPEEVWRDRIDELVRVDPAELLANPLNARRHPAAQRAALRATLAGVGWVAPVIVNTTTGHLVDGHARIEEAVAKGVPLVPVVYVDLSIDEELEILATLDPIGQMATYDADVLTNLLAGVKSDAPQIKKLLGDLAATAGSMLPEHLRGWDDGDAHDGGDDDAGDAEGDEGGTGSLLDLFAVTITDPTTVVRDGDVWQIGDATLVVADVLTGHAHWIPYLEGTDRLFLPYPGPTILMTDEVAHGDPVLVQPLHYLAATIIDRALLMFPGRVVKLEDE